MSNMLETLVDIDFSKAVTSAKKFNKELDSLNSNMQQLDKTAKTVTSVSINRMFSEAVKKIDGDDFRMDVNLKEDITKKLNDAVASYIQRKFFKPTLKGEVELSVNASLIDTQKLNQQIASSISNNVDFSNFSKVRFKLTQENITAINKKLSSQLNKVLTSTGGIKIDTSSIDEATKEKHKVQLHIDSHKLETISKRLTDSILNFYSSPEGIVLGDFKPVNINSEQLKNSLEKLSSALSDADKYLNIPDNLLANVPSLAKSLQSARDNLSKIMTDTVAVTEQLSALSGGEKNQKSLAEFAANVKGIRQSIFKMVENFTGEMYTAIKNQPMGTLTSAELQATVAKINAEIEAGLLKSVHAVEIFANAFKSSPVSIENSDAVLKQFLSIQSSITSHMLTNLEKELPKLMHIDGEIPKAIGEFNKTYAERIKEKVKQNALAINTAIITNQDNLVADIQAQVSKDIGSAIKYVQDKELPDNITVSVPTSVLVSKSAEFARQTATSVFNSLKFSGFGSTEERLVGELDKKVKPQELINDLKASGRSIDGIVELLNKKADSAKKNKELYVSAATQAKTIIGQEVKIDDVSKEISNSLYDFIRLQSTQIVREYTNVLSDVKGREFDATVTKKINDSITKLQATIQTEVSKQISSLATKSVSSIKSLMSKESSEHKELVATTIAESGALIRSSYLQMVKELAEQKMSVKLAGGGEEPITITVNSTDLEPKIINSLQSHIESVVSDVVVKLAKSKATKKDNTEMSELNSKISTAIRTFVKTKVEDIVGSYVGALAIPYDTSKVKGVGKEIKESSDKIANELVRQVGLINNAILLNITKIEYDELGNREKQRINNILRTSMAKLVHVYSESLIDSIQILYNTAEIKDLSVNNLKNALKEQMDKATFMKAEGNIDLTDAYNSGLARVSTMVNKSISTWKVPSGSLNRGDFNDLMRPALDSLVQTFGDAINAEIGSFMEANGSKNAKFFVKRMNTITTKFFNTYTDAVINDFGKLNSTEMGSIVGFDTAKLNSKIRSGIAKRLNVSTDELVKAIPELKGEDVNIVFSQLFKMVFDKFSDELQEQMMQGVKAYKQRIGEVEITPDMSPVYTFINNMQGFQQEVVKKAKELLNAQFKALITEIRGVKITPQSLQVQSIVNPAVDSFTNTVASGAIKSNKPSRSMSGVSNSDKDLMLSDLPVSPYSSDIVRSRDGHSRGGFTNSVVNTLRYIVAGHLVGQPIFTNASEAWTSYKEVGYEMEKARQNILSKYRDRDAQGNLTQRPFEDLANQEFEFRSNNLQNVGELYNNLNLTEQQKKDAIEEIRQSIEEVMDKGIIKPLQNMAISYGVSQQDMAKVWQISTRSQDNPFDAFSMASAAAKIYATERGEIDPVQAALGMESIVAQWRLNPSARTETGERVTDKYSNMLIKTSLLSQASAKDLLDGMSRAGSIFNEFLGDMPTDKKFATSLSYLSLFTQATGRPGAEAGTFFRNVMIAPFKKETSDYLSQVSKSTDPTIAKVNPYNVTYNADGVPVYQQKGFHEIFTNIVNASRRMRELGNDKEAVNLLNSIFKTRTFGYEQGLEALLFKMFDKLDAAGLKDWGQYIDSIKNVQQGEIDEYIGGLSSTPKFRNDQLKSLFQATSYDILENLKPEYMRLLDGLTGVLRAMQGSAGTWSSIISTLGKLGIGLAVMQGLKFAGGKVRSQLYSAEYENSINPLVYDRAGLARHRYEQKREYVKSKEEAMKLLGDKSALYEPLERDTVRLGELLPEYNAVDATFRQAQKDRAEISTLEKRRAGLKNSLAKAPEQHHSDILGKIQATEYNLDEIRRKPNTSDESFNALKSRRDALSSEKSLLEMRIGKGSGAMAGIDAQQREAVTRAVKYKQEVTKADVAIQKLTAQIERLSKAFKTLGASEEILEHTTNKVVKTNEKKVYSEGAVVRSTGRLTRETEELGESYDEAYIDARRFIAEQNKLNNNKAISIGGGMGGTLTQGGMGAMMGRAGTFLKGAGQLALITAGMDVLGDALSGIALTSGERTRQSVEKTQNMIDRFGYLSEIKDSDSNFGVKTARGFLPMATLMWDAVKGAITDAVSGNGVSLDESFKIYMGSAQGKSKSEIMEDLELSKKKAEADRAIGEFQRAEYEQSVYARMQSLDGSVASGARSELIGGSYESMAEFLDRLKQDNDLAKVKSARVLSVNQSQAKYDGFREDSALMTVLMKDFLNSNIENLENSNQQLSKIMRDMEKQTGFTGADPTYKLVSEQFLENEKEVAELRIQLLETEANKLSEIQNQYDLAFSKLSLSAAKTTYSLLNQGFRKDSVEVVNAQMYEVSRRIDLLKEENDKIRKVLETSKLTAEVRDAKEKELNDNEQQIIQLKTQQLDSPMLIAQAISNDFTRKKTLSNSGFSIQKSLLEMRGYGEDSTAMKALQRLELQEQNSYLAQEISKLKAQMESTSNKSVQEDILIQIRNYEAQSAQNLASIYKLQKQSGFGLPAGLKPMTDYEYEAKKNTQRSLMVQQGNVYVTVKFDNVYANSKDDVDKMADRITEVMNNLNRNVANNLVNQVRRK